MPSSIFTTALLIAGLKTNPMCPRPLLLNIDLNHKIDRGVFKRTFTRCRHAYKKSPCLVRLSQPRKGAFHAVCGETQTGLKDGVKVAENPSTEAEDLVFEPNCSSGIFENYMSEDWATFQAAPIVPKADIRFCESLDTVP